MQIGEKNSDLIFISYATTDATDLATWLAVKLISAGYNVWIDKAKLTGGRPFINDIESAIKNNCCRFLALMSPDSILRPNPKRERSLASQVRDQRKIDDFIIPIRAHRNIKSSDLDFYTTDHQWIDFTTNRADGLRSLLAVFNEARIPKSSTPIIELDQLIYYDAKPEQKEETLWSNIFKIDSLPSSFQVYSFERSVRRDEISHWPSWRLRGTNNYIAFRPPPNRKIKFEEHDCIDWKSERSYTGIPTINILKSLIKKEFEQYSLNAGLKFSPCGKRLYFPKGVLDKDKIFFNGHQGKTWISLISDRKYLAAKDGRCLGHLAFTFKMCLDDLEAPLLYLNPALHITYSDGTPIPTARIPGRRKKFTQTWFNYAWLSRVEAIASFLSNHQEKFDVLRNQNGVLSFVGKPSTFKVDKGIDEGKLNDFTQDHADSLIFEATDEEEAQLESTSL